MERSKRMPEIGHNAVRLVEDRKTKQKFKTQAGTALCRSCGAIGLEKHWFLDQRMANKLAKDPLVRYDHCPGCKRVASKHYEGEVFLSSPLLRKNKQMVYGTIHHTAASAFHNNPLAQIAVIEDKGDSIHILTTTCSLAERLGKAFQRSMKGHVEIKPSPGEKFVIVNWHRDI